MTISNEKFQSFWKTFAVFSSIIVMLNIFMTDELYIFKDLLYKTPYIKDIPLNGYIFTALLLFMVWDISKMSTQNFEGHIYYTQPNRFWKINIVFIISIIVAISVSYTITSLYFNWEENMPIRFIIPTIPLFLMISIMSALGYMTRRFN